MSKIRRKHSREFKFKVAIEALKEQKTIAQICREYAIYESQVHAWRKQLKEQAVSVFDERSSSKAGRIAELEKQIRDLNEYIGELSVENKFFKKNSNF